MSKAPLRIFDKSVTEKWDFEKQVYYEGKICQILRSLDKAGVSCTIEYVDECLNVLHTIKVD
tara:strand:+ start:169 stop:354 length:186 start_codon:yes stop_codon:yes gene_type:complete